MPVNVTWSTGSLHSLRSPSAPPPSLGSFALKDAVQALELEGPGMEGAELSAWHSFAFLPTGMCVPRLRTATKLSTTHCVTTILPVQCKCPIGLGPQAAQIRKMRLFHSMKP